MSSEGPSRIPPHQARHSQDTKAAREAAQKIEKVREIDPDEEMQRRKRKFQMMMGDEDTLAETQKGQRNPTPFEVQFHQPSDAEKTLNNIEELPFSLPSAAASIEKQLEDEIVPSPSYSVAPNLQIPSTQEPLEEEDEPMQALPQSKHFWSQSDLTPDTPPKKQQYHESNRSSLRKEDPLLKSLKDKEEKERSKKLQPSLEQPLEEKFSPTAIASSSSKKIKPSSLRNSSHKINPSSPFIDEKPLVTQSDPKKPLPLSEIKKSSSIEKQPFVSSESKPEKKDIRAQSKPKEDSKEENRSLLRSKKRKEKKIHEEPRETQEPHATAFQSIEKTHKDKEDRNQQTFKIENVPLSLLPKEIQPAAITATVNATPYLSPQTIPLFFQIVGTLYIMSAPPGVSRTEFVLNNPTFANSRFFGSKITLEKYATAPDSFNIRLTGSETAVNTFRDHIPDLMAAFQNGNYAFRVNRIDADYSVERPVFRRKEQSKENDSGGGEFKDRRK